MELYAVNVRDRVIQRMTYRYNGMDRKRFLSTETDSVQPARAKPGRRRERLAAPIVGSAAIVIVTLVKVPSFALKGMHI
jgi:hypothetical protein